MISEDRLNIREDWHTPISGTYFVELVKLIDDGALSITFFVTTEEKQNLYYRFRWHEFCAYRNTLEEHRLPWNYRTETKSQSQPTNIVRNSSWIAELREGNDLLDILQSGVRHYVIGNATYTTEIISNQEPEITIVDEE